jgi:hypothetical protein
VTVLAEEIAIIRLRERHKQVPKQDIPKEPYYGGRNDFVPTGLLVFEIYDSYAYRPILQDTKKRRIEDSINSILIEWVHKAGRSRIGRRLAEEARKRHEEQERIRRQQELERQRRLQELQARQKVEQDRVDGLLAQVDSWKKSQDLRSYIEAVERFLIQRDGIIADGSEAQKWLTWARQQADRFDPLAPTPASVLDERLE